MNQVKNKMLETVYKLEKENVHNYIGRGNRLGISAAEDDR